MNTSYHDLLKRMPTEKIPVIVHKRNNKGTVIVMDLIHFADLLLYQPKEEE